MDTNIGVLVSGKGGVLAGLIRAREEGLLKARIAAVIADRQCPALDLAGKNDIPAYPVIESKRQVRDEKIIALLDRDQVELVILAGYFKILSETFVKRYWRKILNVHPSLLPAFAGMIDREVHQAVLDRGCKITGITVHLVDQGCDTGTILDQTAIRVADTDTVDSLRERVKTEEQRFFPRVIQRYIEENTLN